MKARRAVRLRWRALSSPCDETAPREGGAEGAEAGEDRGCCSGGMKGAAALADGGRSKDHSDRWERGPQQAPESSAAGAFDESETATALQASARPASTPP